MDIQVLNEIANPARQASLSQVRASVSAHAQLEALRGNSVPAPENPASPLLEDVAEQIQGPVTPDISSVARAASAYSAAIGNGLNSDELGAIQDLAGKIRTAVSDFLKQSDLEQAQNAATVVASNPEAIQNFTSSVEQAVVETLNIPTTEDGVVINAVIPDADLPANVPVPENPVSIERITNSTEFNNPVQVVAASLAVGNSRVNENTSVENPVTAEEVPESPNGDFRVTAAGPALQNAPTGENIQVEPPVSREAVVPQQEPVSGTDAVSPNNQEPVTAASLALINSRAGESTNVESSVPVEEVVENSSGDLRAIAPNPVSQNAQADNSAQVVTGRSEVTASPAQEPVTRHETVAANPQDNPVSPPDAVPASNQESPVTAASLELQNAQPQNVEAGDPVNIPAPPVDQEQGLEANPARAINPEGASSQAVSDLSDAQPASSPQPAPAQSNNLFAQEEAAVNPENIRDVNELVNSVVDNEFASEAKKIFSEPKVIRTVADLADFILERLQEIIATKQQQSQSSNEFGLL